MMQKIGALLPALIEWMLFCITCIILKEIENWTKNEKNV